MAGRVLHWPEREMLERMATIQADLAIVPIGTHAQYDRTDAQAI
jgi:hypothetical protein